MRWYLTDTRGGVPQIPGVVSDRYPNNTSIKKTNLNNVNRAGWKGVVENSREEIRGEKTKSKENINDIKNNIRKSLEENNKESISVVSNLEKDSNPENNQSEGSKTGEYFTSN